jgi:hypothetical protein
VRGAHATLQKRRPPKAVCAPSTTRPPLPTCAGRTQLFRKDDRRRRSVRLQPLGRLSSRDPRRPARVVDLFRKNGPVQGNRAVPEPAPRSGEAAEYTR